MKRMRILALVVAVMMLAAMPAMAEAKLHRITIGNIAVQQNADEPTKIGVGLQASGGLDGERGYFSASVAGNGEEIASFEAAIEGEQITLAADGLTSNYTISQGDIEALVDSAAAEETDMPFTPDDIRELIESYVAGIQEAVELEKNRLSPEEQQKMLEDMGFAKGAVEDVQVNGQVMSLTRYDFDMGAGSIDRIMGIALEKMPSMKAYFEKYVAILQSAVGAGDEQITFDPEHLYSSIFGMAGVDLRITGAMWMDELGENLRIEMTETVIGGENTAPEGVTIPIVMQLNTDASGQHLAYDVNVPDANTTVAFRLNDAQLDEGAKGNFSMVIDADGQRVTADGSIDRDADGKGSASASIVAPIGEGVESKNTLSINSTGGDANTHSIQLRTIQLQADGSIKRETSRTTISFDITTEAGELPAGVLIDNGKPTVAIAAMTEEQQEGLQTELITKGITSYGALMQADGVAKLISDAVMAVQQLMSASDVSVDVAA